MSPAAERHYPVGKFKQLQHLLGICSQLFQFIVRFRRVGELDQLNLVELVLPDQAAGYPCRRNRLRDGSMGCRLHRVSAAHSF